MNFTEFLRRNGKIINNVGVVAAVLIAIYIKVNDENAAVLFGINDLFIIGGAFLAFGLLFMLKKKKH